MHARRHYWSVLILSVVVSVGSGCRGTRPHDSLVQVTKTQDVEIPNVDAPDQRLAVSKSRKDAGAERMQRLTATKPGIEQVSAKQPVAETSSRKTNGTSRADRSGVDPNASPHVAGQRPANETVTVSLNDREDNPVRTASAESSEDKPVAKSQASVSDAPSGQDLISEMTEEEMAAAFDSQPKRIKEIALKQLSAAISKTATATTQPADLDAAIAEAIDHLPDLPDDTGVQPAIPATRIGESRHADTGDGDARPSDGSESSTGNSAADVKSTAHQPVGDEGKVKPASASRTDGERSMVNRASGDPGQPTTSASANTLSDEVLYKELLDRLSRAPIGETEAQRAARLIKRRHLMVLSGNPDAAVASIESMSNDEQEFLRHQLLGLWTMINPEGHPIASRRFTIALPELRLATRFAAAATDSLDVRSLSFCSAIESYGQVKRFSGSTFDAGQQVILYCEIENFAVNETEGGFETHLQGSYDIYDENNEKVVSQLLPADKQVSANYLRDYFIAYQMHLPQQLTAGSYRLQLTMEDVTGKKYGQASVDLEIAK